MFSNAGGVTISTPISLDHTGFSTCRAQIATWLYSSGIRRTQSWKAKNAATYGLLVQSSRRVGKPLCCPSAHSFSSLCTTESDWPVSSQLRRHSWISSSHSLSRLSRPRDENCRSNEDDRFQSALPIPRKR